MLSLQKIALWSGIMSGISQNLEILFPSSSSASSLLAFKFSLCVRDYNRCFVFFSNPHNKVEACPTNVTILMRNVILKGSKYHALNTCF
jgi:hypothetical protein